MDSQTFLERLNASPLETIELECGTSRALLTLQGAHLVSYTHQGRELLWVSPKTLLQPGKAIRGGIPICWPWFGAHPSDPKRPAHGFARTSDWAVTQHRTTESISQMSLRLVSRDSSYPLSAELQIELTPAHLEIHLITRNIGSDSIWLTEALHTYLPVSDLQNAALYGLEGCRYADKLKGYATDVEKRHAIYLTEPTDRVYYDPNEQLTLVDSESNQTLEIAKQGSSTTVVWNAGREIAAQMADLGEENYRGYICVEAANALDAGIELGAGEEHRLTQRLTCR